MNCFKNPRKLFNWNFFNISIDISYIVHSFSEYLNFNRKLKNCVFINLIIF